MTSGGLPPVHPAPVPEDGNGSLVERYARAMQFHGLLATFLTVPLAFVVAGLVVVATTGKNPLTTYQGIFEGAGLDWPLALVTGGDRSTAAFNLQQTLLLTTPFVLTGLAVAFAFRCGLFNIGGQGQYLVGSVLAVWIGSSLPGTPPAVHVVLAVVAATVGGAVWAGIAGILKAAVGAHEVITTIMLNWIAISVALYLFRIGGPLQSDTQTHVPISNDVAPGARLPVIWGDPEFQGLTIGIFVALGALAVYWLLLERTTLGYGVKAVGFNSEAARYAGISVGWHMFLAMAISGAFAGLAGAMDILGWQFRIATGDVSASQIGYLGIAVALLGRTNVFGVGLAAFLFASLVTGTSTRNLDPEVFRPELAGNLTLLIQGLIVLFVAADVIVLWILRRLTRREEVPA
ncbi:MAG TPA: ABC transporter permease [Gaiella sp.]|jgi:simple sugar transport system permease protein|nr:ABC transporter permease [Gaiella sp.]